MHSITNTRFRFDGDRCSCTSQWHVIHRLRHHQGFTDFWHQGRYPDVSEKRDGERPERPAMDDLWAGFRALGEATR